MANYDLVNLDVNIDNMFANFSRSGIGSKEKLDALNAQ